MIVIIIVMHPSSLLPHFMGTFGGVAEGVWRGIGPWILEIFY